MVVLKYRKARGKSKMEKQKFFNIKAKSINNNKWQVKALLKMAKLSMSMFDVIEQSIETNLNILQLSDVHYSNAIAVYRLASQAMASMRSPDYDDVYIDVDDDYTEEEEIK